MKENEIRQKLYEIRRQSREKYLKLMEVDIKTVRELEQSVDKEYNELIRAIQDNLKEAGEERAEMHKMSHNTFSSMMIKEAEALLDPASITDLGAVAYVHPCVYPFSASPAPPPHDEVILDPPTGGGNSGSVTYNSADNIAHPKAEAWGQGTGTINSSTVKTSFRFSFTPSKTKWYCIRPVVYMNGHWLVWTWGTCGGTPEDLGSGVAKVILRVRVDQLSIPVAQREHVVLEKTASAGQDIQSGFGYNSEVHGGTALEVKLQGGHEAVVWVECESYAQIANHGRAWVDMQTSPFFYYSVPEVRWGWRSYFPWVWLIS